VAAQQIKGNIMKKYWLSLIGVFCFSAVSFAGNGNIYKWDKNLCVKQPFLIWGDDVTMDKYKFDVKKSMKEIKFKENDYSKAAVVPITEDGCKNMFNNTGPDFEGHKLKAIGLFNFERYSITASEKAPDFPDFKDRDARSYFSAMLHDKSFPIKTFMSCVEDNSSAEDRLKCLKESISCEKDESSEEDRVKCVDKS
jgi:hypothetical protein